MTTQNLLVELFVEELPPKALKKLGESFAGVLAEQLKVQGLTSADTVVTPYASPRRLAAHISHVWLKAEDKAVQQKLMPVAVGLDAAGHPTAALLKKLGALGADVTDPATLAASLKRAPDGKAEALFYDSLVTGATLDIGLQKALDRSHCQVADPQGHELPARDRLRAARLEQRELRAPRAQPGGAARHHRGAGQGAGPERGPHHARPSFRGRGLAAGNCQCRRATLNNCVAQRRRRDRQLCRCTPSRDSLRQLTEAAAEQVEGGCKPIEDDALLDEVTALVERPNVLLCHFEPEFLAVPQECLILTMKANQKYFPLLDAEGKLTDRFLIVSNISPADPSRVIEGNERVVRPRLADAKFFFDQDRKKTLESRVTGLDKVVYHNKLGTQGERMARVRAIARVIGQQLGGETLAQAADTAARLAKTDLLTDMVGEFPELQGIMGGYYARHDGLSEDIAFAIEDHYKPRFAGDELPRNAVGVAVALADKLETLVGMFGIGNLPSGDKDPFALRRHALGVIRMLTEKDLPLDSGRAGGRGCACLRRQDCRCLPGADRLHLRPSGRLASRSGLQRAGSRRGAGAAPSAPGTGRPAAGGGAGLCRAA
jgi:glycyl-tRNA synthetase beta chain